MKTFPSEIRTFKDPLTGRTVCQLTTTGNNYHLYFTENAFVRGKNEIIFLSDRASGVDRSPEDEPHYNVFSMNLYSGEMMQLTDEDSPVARATKTPDGHTIVYNTKKQIKSLDTVSGKVTLLYTEQGNYNLASPSISPNQRYIGFIRNEKIGHEHGPNYSGFKERYYLVKDARITIAALGTTLPDIAASYHAARRGFGDLALGEGIGANIVTVLLTLGLMGIMKPIDFDISKVLPLIIVLNLATVLVLVFMTRGMKITQLGGVVLVSTYFGMVLSLVLLSVL